jgi:hypothetical protein
MPAADLTESVADLITPVADVKRLLAYFQNTVATVTKKTANLEIPVTYLQKHPTRPVHLKNELGLMNQEFRSK